jgi:hypothetical protein
MEGVIELSTLSDLIQESEIAAKVISLEFAVF